MKTLRAEADPTPRPMRRPRSLGLPEFGLLALLVAMLLALSGVVLWPLFTQ